MERSRTRSRRQGPFIVGALNTLAARREPSNIASASVIDRRLIPAGRFTTTDPPSRIVVRRRAAGVGRRGAADDIAARIVERSRLRRRVSRQNGEHRRVGGIILDIGCVIRREVLWITNRAVWADAM